MGAWYCRHLCPIHFIMFITWKGNGWLPCPPATRLLPCSPERPAVGLPPGVITTPRAFGGCFHSP